MLEHVKNIFTERGISLVSAVPLSACPTVREYKLKRAGFDSLEGLSAIMLAVPYLSPAEKRNLSAYAAARDYHYYFKQLFNDVIPLLKQEYPQYTFAGFADDSPIDERKSAAAAGLGIIGDHGLLITEFYSSYVFLGEIITDLPLPASPHEVKRCEGCGSCKRVCPISEVGICLSEITQKKGELSQSEGAAIKKYGSAWGCDLCQNACPHTKKAMNAGTLYTNVPFFKESLIPELSLEALERMSNEEFALRAYSWRKRNTIQRNLAILEDD